MSVLSSPSYWLTCDRCGVSSVEDSEYSGWGDIGSAEDCARDSDWWTDDGHHLCWDCIPHEPDWDDEHAAAAQGTAELVCKWCRPAALEAQP